MNYKQGDLLYTEIDNQFHLSKILRVDEFFGIYHICGYAPLDKKPEVSDIPNLIPAIGHAPVAEFPGAVFVANLPVLTEELDGYLTYLAVTDFASYLKMSGQDTNAIVTKANEAYTHANTLADEKKYEEAIEYYTVAFETFPLFFEAMDNRAFCKMDLARWQSAINDFRISLYVNPGSVLAEFSIGECFFKMRDYASAKTQFERALAIDPNDKLSNEFLAKTLDIIGH